MSFNEHSLIPRVPVQEHPLIPSSIPRPSISPAHQHPPFPSALIQQHPLTPSPTTTLPCPPHGQGPLWCPLCPPWVPGPRM